MEQQLDTEDFPLASKIPLLMELKMFQNINFRSIEQ